MYSAHRIWSSRRRLETTSPGEVFWYALRDWFIASGANSQSTPRIDLIWADPKGKLTQFLDSAVVSSVCIRMIDEARRCLANNIEQSAEPQVAMYRDSVIDNMKQYCVDPLGMSFSDRTIAVFAESAFACAAVARQTISERSRTLAFKGSPHDLYKIVC
jgi:hypothetical protein